MTIADAVLAKRHVPVEWLGLVHVLWGYAAERERWAFFCGDPYEGAGDSQRISEDPITCLQCFGLSTKDDKKLATPW